MVQAIIAKNVLDTELDAFSQTAALWAFIVFTVANERSQAADVGANIMIVPVTAAEPALYALWCRSLLAPARARESSLASRYDGRNDVPATISRP
jgi:hypothetical protein